MYEGFETVPSNEWKQAARLSREMLPAATHSAVQKV